MKKLRLLPELQEYFCNNGHPIRERKRKPCPSCGSLNRIISRDSEDNITTKDKA